MGRWQSRVIGSQGGDKPVLPMLMSLGFTCLLDLPKVKVTSPSVTPLLLFPAVLTSPNSQAQDQDE